MSSVWHDMCLFMAPYEINLKNIKILFLQK